MDIVSFQSAVQLLTCVLNTWNQATRSCSNEIWIQLGLLFQWQRLLGVAPRLVRVNLYAQQKTLSKPPAPLPQ